MKGKVWCMIPTENTQQGIFPAFTLWKKTQSLMGYHTNAGIILWMDPANERQR